MDTRVSMSVCCCVPTKYESQNSMYTNQINKEIRNNENVFNRAK